MRFYCVSETIMQKEEENNPIVLETVKREVDLEVDTVCIQYTVWKSQVAISDFKNVVCLWPHVWTARVCWNYKHTQITALCHQANFRAYCFSILKIKNINLLPIYCIPPIFIVVIFSKGNILFVYVNLIKAVRTRLITFSLSWEQWLPFYLGILVLPPY